MTVVPCNGSRAGDEGIRQTVPENGANNPVNEVNVGVDGDSPGRGCSMTSRHDVGDGLTDDDGAQMGGRKKAPVADVVVAIAASPRINRC